MAKFTPLHDRVLIKRFQGETVTKTGILIPDVAKERPAEGKVIAVGTGKVREDGSVQTLGLKPGDEILFPRYSGTEIKIDGEEFLIMREDEILGITLQNKGKTPYVQDRITEMVTTNS
jgi:chaperonin GroES